ncbi:hypothetical protein JCM6882_001496 [Rhodosporidiobolus microsporus]
MASERSPLLPSRPTLGRPLDTITPDAASVSSADGPDARGGVKGQGREAHYEENEELKACNVFQSVHRVYELIQGHVDIPLSEEQLRNPELHFNIVLPLEELLAATNEPSVVYVLLLVRLQFLREGHSALSSSSLNESRAFLCELLAVRLLRHQASTATGKGPGQGLLAMARALVGGFHAFQGASEEVLERIRQKEGYASRVGALSGAGKTNALELAILGKARMFIKSQSTQRVIQMIYDGRITYSSSSFIDILPDRYKNKRIALYNVRQAPLLDHYRLRVPKYRNMIEFGSFLVLFVAFILVIVDRHAREPTVSRISFMEVFFAIYSMGYSLDKLASIAEHGWSVYAAGLTNGLDAASVPIYIAAFALRVHSLVTNDPHSSDRAYAILSTAACLLFPRLAFTAISNNLLILSLRAMLADFLYLLGITVFCFVGFVFALNHLSEGDYSVGRISEWLVFIFFGLDGSGIDESPRFDPILGPILFVSFAALSNTLLTSVLVAILSTTYATIAADAAAEDMFRKAVNCFEGVKSNSLFDYVPPFNMVALAILWPLSHFLSPRWFHKINVLATRTLSLPILLLIALYERQSAPEALLGDWLNRLKVGITARLPSAWSEKLSLLEGAHWECEAVFEYTPSGDEKDSSDDEYDDESTYGGEDEIEEEFRIDNGASPSIPINARASVVLDPVRIQAAQQKMQSQARLGMQSGAPSSATSTRSVSTPSVASPIPLSRQPSFAHDPESSSTIRAPKQTSRPPIPQQPSSPPNDDRDTIRRFSLSDNPLPVFSESPPASPRHRRLSKDKDNDNTPPATRFAPLPHPSRGGAHGGGGGGSRDLRRSQTTHERLPPNAAHNTHRKRRSSVDDHAPVRVEWPELSASAPAKESPLARLYAHPALSDDLDAFANPAAAGKGGAVRRRLSMGPASGGGGAGHQRFGSEGAALSSSVRSRRVTAAPAPAGGADEPSATEMMQMIKGLVATVARLEKKLDDERVGRRSADA